MILLSIGNIDSSRVFDNDFIRDVRFLRATVWHSGRSLLVYYILVYFYNDVTCVT